MELAVCPEALELAVPVGTDLFESGKPAQGGNAL
jgi:hypothetical protein